MVCTCAAHYTSVQQRIPMGDFDKALCNSNFRNIFAFAWVAEDIYIPTWLTDKWRLGQKVMKTRSLLEFIQVQDIRLSFLYADRHMYLYIIQLSKNSKKDVGQIALTIVNHPNILTLIIV